jgi:hypothetical protein
MTDQEREAFEAMLEALKAAADFLGPASPETPRGQLLDIVRGAIAKAEEAS